MARFARLDWAIFAAVIFCMGFLYWKLDRVESGNALAIEQSRAYNNSLEIWMSERRKEELAREVRAARDDRMESYEATKVALLEQIRDAILGRAEGEEREGQNER